MESIDVKNYKLNAMTWRKLFDGWTTPCKIIKVYDGDTFHCVFNLPTSEKQLYWASCRLKRVSAPELRRKDRLGEIVRDKVENRWLGQECTLKFEDVCIGSFGRPLVELYDEHGDSINDWIIKLDGVQKYNA